MPKYTEEKRNIYLLQEKPISTSPTHTDWTLGHSEHRAQEEHGTPSPRQNKQIVADFKSNSGNI